MHITDEYSDGIQPCTVSYAASAVETRTEELRNLINIAVDCGYEKDKDLFDALICVVYGEEGLMDLNV